MTAESGEFLLSLSQEFFGPLFQNLDITTEAMVLTTGTLMKSLWRRLLSSVLASQELVQSDVSRLDKDVSASARATGSMPEFKDMLIDAIATSYFVDQSPEIGAVLLKTIEHAAKIAIAQESLYKQRVNKYEGMDDDAIDKATFKEMLPDFAEDFKAPDESMTIPDGEPQDAVPGVEEKTVEEQDVTLIGKLHRTVFDAAELNKCSGATMAAR
ncbi:hypothetical protein EC968_004812 [Mortierella alpina]|nr:hypothetical protein EC968_004812 [Mortierella alpina]